MRLVAIASCVVLLLAAVATFRAPGSTRDRGARPRATEVVRPGAAELVAPTGGGTRRAGIQEPAHEGAAAGVPGALPSPGPGTVYGLVVDVDWSPIAEAHVEFHGPEGHVVVARSADDGTYRCTVPAGPHQVFSSIRGFAVSDQAADLTEDRASSYAGELDVQPGLDHEFHVHAQGERTLTGGVYCSELERLALALDPPPPPTDENRDDATGLRLVGELRTWFPPHHTVATLELETSSEAYAIYLLRVAEADAARASADGTEDREHTPPAPPPADEIPPGLGGFRLEGLAAARYELRLFADAERQRHVTLEIDLTEGDVAFEPLDVPLADFLGRARWTPDRLPVTPRPR